MPAGVDAVNIDGDYSAILHKIEGIVIKWTHQVWGLEFLIKVSSLPNNHIA